MDACMSVDLADVVVEVEELPIEVEGEPDFERILERVLRSSVCTLLQTHIVGRHKYRA